MSMLIDVLPPEARRIVYAVYAFAVFVLGCIQVGYTAAGLEQPGWLTVALAVSAFVGVGIGAVAASNTPALSESERYADAVIEADRVASLLEPGPDPDGHVRWHQGRHEA